MVTYTGIYSNIQEGQASIQTANPTIQDSTTKFKEEAKTLGAIQIIIGVMHVGFGIILGLMNTSIGGVLGFGATSFISGYNFWGGISFIVSGSLSIPASKMVSPCLIKGSLGMNIVSAIFSMIGVILLLVDMIINGNPWQDYWALISGKGISAMLMISAILEFCIACVLAHFATQVISNHTANSIESAQKPASRSDAVCTQAHSGHLRPPLEPVKQRDCTQSQGARGRPTPGAGRARGSNLLASQTFNQA
ncbi:membrane-spanning 4-domains subfamily A member 12 [Rhynchocyon petersi]